MSPELTAIIESEAIEAAIASKSLDKASM